MLDTTPKIWESNASKQLVTVLAGLTNPEDIQKFMRDVMTEKEITEISARLEAARLLSTGSNYAQITADTRLSSRTVARISNWMKHGTTGYAAALALLEHRRNTKPLEEA